MKTIIPILILLAIIGLQARSNSALQSKYNKLEGGYKQYLKKFSNVDLIYSTLFKDAFEKATNRQELLEYFRSEMELVYKRTTIGEKGDNTALYTEQEMLDAQTTSIIRQILRPWMPEIDGLAGEYYEKYNSDRNSQ